MRVIYKKSLKKIVIRHNVASFYEVTWSLMYQDNNLLTNEDLTTKVKNVIYKIPALMYEMTKLY